ncbi:hypothetical protein DICPUDRAFT_77411 [Dictyostelium purpureum]|uniref:Mitochondrial genome maintenance protein MGM101 n=1 Tax=Dictyostelium purpureum TaxID=5786 RepID=F0ZGI9_DICPU|nr:uncharacterized protein DICPUDRAFT_77411 [Dictyostelium purpureum]EGC36966.1 hypothetical protein DICPUDRAFT_77411 [Dictyostelium purpureum]|eukprot:XP_003286534.1 hypothetical protein DICPUDRAFT_77411 [Dictyostelium purpureum]
MKRILVQSSRILLKPNNNKLLNNIRLFSSATSNTNQNNSFSYNKSHESKVLFNDPSFYSEEKYQGISKEGFPKDVTDVLLAELNPVDIEIKPDGLIYLPEIKYRRILNQAFGPGGWALKPFGPPVVEHKTLMRPYALYCQGRYVSESIGEQAYFEGSFISFATATEAAKSNALVRCCKDLGVGSSLWDPTFIRQWKSLYATEKTFENVKSKDRKVFWVLNNGIPNQLPYPWKEVDYSRVPQSSQVNQPIQETITFDDNLNKIPKSTFNTEKETTRTTTEKPETTNTTTVTEKDEEEIDFDVDDLVPPQFKKYAGKTWRELLGDPKGISYLGWVAKSFDQNSPIRSQALAILSFIESQNNNQQNQ